MRITLFAREALTCFLATLLVLTLVFGTFASIASAASSFVVITIDSANIDSNLSDFPVFVDLSDMPADFWNNVTSSGGDIRVYDASISELPYELVSFSTSSSTGSLFFKAPQLSTTVDSKFIIHYGDNTKTAYAANHAYGSENVWKSSYNAVLHFEQAPTGLILDSTANGNHASSTAGAMTAGDKVDGGIAGSAVEMDGTDDRIQIAHDSSISWEYNDEFTISGWVKVGSSGHYHGLAAKIQGAGSLGKGWVCESETISSPTGDTPQLSLLSTVTYKAAVRENTDIQLDDNDWHYIACTYDGSSNASGINLFVDGDVMTNLYTVRDNLTNHSITNTGPVEIGNHSAPVKQTMDELRFSTEEMTEEWMKAEYLNMSNTTAFYTISSF